MFETSVRGAHSRRRLLVRFRTTCNHRGQSGFTHRLHANHRCRASVASVRILSVRTRCRTSTTSHYAVPVSHYRITCRNWLWHVIQCTHVWTTTPIMRCISRQFKKIDWHGKLFIITTCRRTAWKSIPRVCKVSTYVCGGKCALTISMTFSKRAVLWTSTNICCSLMICICS